MTAIVKTLSLSGDHTFSKTLRAEIRLVVGLGVEGDVHAGVTVKHRSRVARDSTQPNLRQVHLIHSELFTELWASGFDVHSGQMGENITTEGIDLLGLPRDTRLSIGTSAVVRVTGLRNPCKQLDDFMPGLMEAVLDRDADGEFVRKSGIMTVVEASGPIKVGDPIRANIPPLPHRPLERV